VVHFAPSGGRVIHRVDARFREERVRYVFRYTCERCAHFEPGRGTCSLGFPNAEHREREGLDEHVVFCKSFELE
jgi:hypothetical protein